MFIWRATVVACFLAGMSGALGACSAGSGGGAPGAGGTTSQCTKDTDCKGARVCQNGQCVNVSGNGGGGNQGTGGSSGGGNGGGASCPVSFSNSTCQSCFAAKCTSACDTCAGDSGCNAALTCIANCSTSACENGCFQGLSTGSANLLDALFKDPNGCIFASCRASCTTPATNGDPCIAGADCTSGECASGGVYTGWCTIQGCTSNEECGIDTAGELVWCSAESGGGYTCFPGCSTDADCSSYGCSNGTAATCQPGTSVNGNSDYVCSC